ncbi:MAG: UDP-N-acetylglucosamine 1-carboxyvinyltransferase [Candidatus Saccharibacteria bacterium]
MSKYVINGGKPLKGEVKIPGSKNAVLPLMTAALLTDGECLLRNLPEIVDVEVMARLLEDLGAEIRFDKIGRTIAIKAGNITKTNPDQALTSRLRASVLLVGPLLGRFGQATLLTSGGDRIGVRPIDAHVLGLRQLGAQVEDGGEYRFTAKKLSGAKIILEESSVTATENLMMAAVLAEGRTIIKLAAMEPHVQQLGEFLNAMGAKITGLGTTTIVIDGVEKLGGAEISVIPDSNQAATFITMAAATRSDIRVSGINPDFMDDFLLKMKHFGVAMDLGQDYVHVHRPEGEYKGISKLQVGLYPKLASDDTPPLSVLATQAVGETMIYEWMYENRLGYAPELNKMGARAEILDPHRVRIIGPTKLKGSHLVCSDIRMGMALVIAALAAEGQSEICEIHHIDRGYDNLEGQLKSLGADIRRVEESSERAAINQTEKQTV